MAQFELQEQGHSSAAKPYIEANLLLLKEARQKRHRADAKAGQEFFNFPGNTVAIRELRKPLMQVDHLTLPSFFCLLLSSRVRVAESPGHALHGSRSAPRLFEHECSSRNIAGFSLGRHETLQHAEFVKVSSYYLERAVATVVIPSPTASDL